MPHSAPLPFYIDINIKTPLWRLHIPTPHTLCHTSLATIFNLLSHPEIGDVSLTFASDAFIQRLNHAYRGQNTPTNVLAFPTTTPTQHHNVNATLGDIVFGLQTIVQQAKTQHKPVKAHIQHLLIHGFLHLQAYTHDTDATAMKMEQLEIAALGQLGIDNPYEIGNPEFYD